MKKMLLLALTALILIPAMVSAQATTVKIAVMKYDGGGDWYSNPTALPNLIAYCNDNLKTTIDPQPGIVEPGSVDIFNYPYVDMTGHGNVVFSEADVANLRTYLESGGFLQITDNYGIDQFIRREMKKVFPELDFIELPFSHPIYSQKYRFPEGLPKIHEHDAKPAQGFGLIYKGRLVCFYNYESDLGDGWEDRSVHNDPEDVRQKALQMGANIISFVFNQ
ncbi:MAG TPA: DUF4159 domain-containing protein [Prolixibacteraceae bacterium]|nr:DUF4159 domain-containing protein [Prolixibacteraceae bacterium]